MNILICHDGSGQTDKALRFGTVIAKACAAEVTLLGIAESGGADAAVLLAHLQRTRESLEGEGVRTELVSKSGAPVPEILGHEEKTDYDLVVIGAGLPSSGMPAKTYELARQIGPPVLLVVGERTGLKKMLICTGGRGYIENVIQQAAEIARATGATITLLHVLAQPPLMYADLIAREEDVAAMLSSDSELGRNLRQQKELIEGLGATVEVLLRHGIVADEVIREVRRGDYDLIVVGSSIDRGPLYRYMLGDVTQEIVNRAPCPVLVARQSARSGSGGLWRRIIRRIFPRRAEKD